MMTNQYTPPLTSPSPGRTGAHRLIDIAREGRLVRQGRAGPVPVRLAAVDEGMLALVDAAMAKGRGVTFVYPAPAGEVSVLLAAQILLHRFLKGEREISVGIVTSDTTGAARTWEELRISTVGDRPPISEYFPCYRAGPEGESPFGRKRFRGVLVGRRFANWPVDVVVMDHLAGPAFGDPHVPTIRVFADPLDPALEQLASRGELVWGWPVEALGQGMEARQSTAQGGVPFSVAHDRLVALTRGMRTTIHVPDRSELETHVRRLRDDLRTFADAAGPLPPPTVLRGLRVAWHHVNTLTSLPCRPTEFDRFAGLPPIAARATTTFAREIEAWARILSGDLADVAMVIASDLEDLRAALDAENPLLTELSAMIGGDLDTVVVVRTTTAARGLLYALDGDPTADTFGGAHIRSIRRLHREGTWDRAIVVGVPPRWDWHRLDSGLTSDLHVLALGTMDARTGRNVLSTLEDARHHWSAAETRQRTWSELVGGDLPLPGLGWAVPSREVVLVTARENPPEIDPFASFESILVSKPLLVGDEGIEEVVAEETVDGVWAAAVDAVEVITDVGTIKLPSNRVVDVREGDRIVDKRADGLEPGAYLLIGRRAGRLGLLEAMAERLASHRPDLLAANLVVRDLQARIRRAFLTSGMTKAQLYEKLVELGFEKTYQTARAYVGEGGPFAPRDLPDLRRLNRALELGMSERRIVETFSGVQRLRVFRRDAGRALATAARDATVAADLARVDPATGLSLADLREVVLEARVRSVHRCPEPVPLAELGVLKPN